MFDDDFINSLPDDPAEGIIQICSQIIKYHTKVPDTPNKHNGYMEAYALLTSYIEANKLGVGVPNYGPDKKNNISQLVKAANDLKAHFEHQINTQSIEHLKSKYQAKFKAGFCYEFTDGDLSRIQELVNELRDLISNNDIFEDNHRQRLLKRLEKLQSELHKKVSDLDRFWGLVGDAGVVLGKLGEDAKPFVDRIKEIADIVWRTQSRTEELPSSTKFPLLSNDSDE